MALTYSDTFSKYEYTLEETGIRLNKKIRLTTTEKFVPFEKLGHKIRYDSRMSALWFLLAFGFFITMLVALAKRMFGVEGTSELLWGTIAFVCYIIYKFRKKHILLLTNDSRTNELEFPGSQSSAKELVAFFAEVRAKQNEYFRNKHPKQTLTADELAMCTQSGISHDDGLFLKNLTYNNIHRYQSSNAVGNNNLTVIFSTTTEANARIMLGRYREEMKRKNKCLFISKIDFNDRYDLALATTTADPYQVIKYIGTHGVKLNVQPEQVVDKWKKWDAQFAISPLVISTDHCECAMVERKADYFELAKEVYQFCTGVRVERLRVVYDLSQDMKVNGRIFLWWD